MSFRCSARLKSSRRSRAAFILGLASSALLMVGVVAHSRGAADGAAKANAPSRIAVIDVQKVLSASNIGKATYAKLKKMQEERIAKAKQMDEEVRKLDSEINAGKLTLGQEKLTAMQKQLAEKRSAMQRYAQGADREIEEARDRELAALDIKVKPIVDAIGKEAGLDAIFNKFESGLLYAADSIDMTDEVIKRLNEAFPTPPAAP